MRYIRRMAWLVPGLSFLAVVWLMSAIEFGVAGTWAKWCVGGIVLYWLVLIAYIKWQEREKKRRQERKRERIAERIMEQADKSYFIRKTMAA